ncbi:hypothetical protein K438DRAFT_1962262 [Mycena galopus ATCC 62051]|nr:hypothetical protein K438DRAFT_1962262 [Mycena galopus ATCC 62051]
MELPDRKRVQTISRGSSEVEDGPVLSDNDVVVLSDWLDGRNFASHEICSTPTANDSTAQALMSAGSSSEERPSGSVKGARSSTLGGKSTASEALSKGYDTGDARTSKTHLDMVVNTLLGSGGNVCRSPCDVLALVPLYLEECDPLSADDHGLDALEAFTSSYSARLVSPRLRVALFLSLDHERQISGIRNSV